MQELELALKQSRHLLDHLMEVLSKHLFILCSSLSLRHGVVQLWPNSESQKWFVKLYHEIFQSDLCPFASLIMIARSYLILYYSVKDDSCYHLYSVIVLFVWFLPKTIVNSSKSNFLSSWRCEPLIRNDQSQETPLSYHEKVHITETYK